jgi:hypothetical protein
MTGWSFGRLKGPAQVLLALALGFALLDLAVSARFGWDSFGGVEQSQSFARLEHASAKAFALERARRAGAPVGLVVGMSTADWGVDLRLLERQDGRHWAKITGEFASFTNLLDVVRRIDAADFAPDRTLLCVHYGMLLGARRQRTTRRERVAQLLERTSAARSSGELSRVVTLSWLGNNRAGAANAFELRLGAAREGLLRTFSQPPEVIYPVDADVFEDTRNDRAPMHPSVRLRHVQQQAERWRLAQTALEHTDAAAQSRALREIVALLGRRSRLVVVLLPEHSALRAVVPTAFAKSLLDAALSPGAARTAPVVVDLRDALADDWFADEVHATGRGRPFLTAALKRAQ